MLIEAPTSGSFASGAFYRELRTQNFSQPEQPEVSMYKIACMV